MMLYFKRNAIFGFESGVLLGFFEESAAFFGCEIL